FGDILVVKAGVCSEGVDVNRPGLTIRAEAAFAVTMRPPPTFNGFNVQSNDTVIDGFVIESGLQGVLAASSGASVTLQRVTLRGLKVQPPSGGTISTNGIQVRDAQDVTVENCIVTGALQQGILLKRVGNAYVRNNLVYAIPNDWAISLDNTKDGAGTIPV